MTWNRNEIRTARKSLLKPVLQKLGYRLEPRPNGNYRLMGTTKEIVIKDHYWICLDDDTSGNSIDFLVKVHGMTFRKAMELLRS